MTRTISEGAAPTTSRRTTSPNGTSSSTRTVASSCRRGPYTHASSPSMSKRSRAFSGWMKTIGPRSLSLTLVAIRRATRRGRLSVSSATVRPHDDIIIGDSHNEPPPQEGIEREVDCAPLQTELLHELRRRRGAQLLHRLPHATFLRRERADDVNPIRLLEHQSESTALQDSLDRLPVLIRDAAKEKIGFPRRIVRLISQQQFRDHFVRA